MSRREYRISLTPSQQKAYNGIVASMRDYILDMQTADAIHTYHSIKKWLLTEPTPTRLDEVTQGCIEAVEFWQECYNFKGIKGTKEGK